MCSKCFAALSVRNTYSIFLTILLYILKVLLTVLLASSASAICMNDTDCSREGVARCNQTTRMCECPLTCFSLTQEVNGTCVMDMCASLDDDGNCRNGRNSRTTALLLSIFLINFGAANFYIERYELAAIQLFLGLFLCCIQVGQHYNNYDIASYSKCYDIPLQ